jgi:hypothetical protein
MVTIWDLLHSAEPYAKTIEYGVIFATLIAAIYSSRRIHKGAKEIQGLEARLFDLSSRMRQAATESADELEDSMRKFGHGMGQMLQNMQGQLADLVEGERGQLLQGSQASRSPQVEDQEGEEEPPTAPQQQEQSSGDAHDLHDQWWRPIVDMKFDDPEQEQPRLYWMNNTRTRLPWPSIWLTAWHNESPNGVCGVALSGRAKRINEVWRRLRKDADEIQRELPEGSTVEAGRFGIGITKPNSEFRNDDERRAWLKATLNTFVNVLRPRIIKAANRTGQRAGDGLAAFYQERQVN